MALNLTEAAQQQAIAEGFAGGPIPTLNPQNVNTQAVLGNPLTPVEEPVPYYPPATSVTPNLGLSLQGLDVVTADNFIILDTQVVSSQASVYASLSNAKVISINQEITATGASVIYTVPTGRKAIILYGTIFNLGGSTTTMFNQYYNAALGATFQMSDGASTTVGSNAYGAVSNSIVNPPVNAYLIMAAGDEYIINSTVQPYYVISGILEFDASSPVKSVFVAPTASQVAIYTVPTGKTAALISADGPGAAPYLFLNPYVGSSSLTNVLGVTNFGASAFTPSVWCVPNGSSPAAQNKLIVGSSVVSTGAWHSTCSPGYGYAPVIMGPGDEVVLQITSGAAASGQGAWVNMIEYAA